MVRIRRTSQASEFDALTEYTTTNPTPPTSGVRLFARRRARPMLAFVGPDNHDCQVQPFWGSNRIGLLTTSSNSATLGTFQVPAPTAYTTATAVAPSASTFFGSLTRIRFPGNSTIAATVAGLRHSNLWHLSSTANKGGFMLVVRGGAALGQSGGGRCVIALMANTAALSNVEPSSLVSLVGFGWDSTDTTQKVIYNDASGTASKIDLGANFPARDYGTYAYEYRLWSPAGSGQQVWWSAQRLNDGVTVSGGPITTDLPALDTLLGLQIVQGSTAAATIAYDLQGVYFETDN